MNAHTNTHAKETPAAIKAVDRQTNRQTDKQTDSRQSRQAGIPRSFLFCSCIELSNPPIQYGDILQ